MKKFILPTILFISSIAFVQCTPKLSKEIQTTTDNTVEKLAIDTTVAFTNEELLVGKSLMETKCGKCHVLFEPTDFTAQDWEQILKSMIPKARLTGRDAELVKEYIIRNAKKS